MNLSYPPSPPMKGARFEYLPAVFPADELTRLAVSEEFDIVWKHWSREKAKGLIECVMAQFGTNYVALSIFDEDSEIFKAENGINQSRIARSTSIAAHCIFSQDVMVVLDTRKVNLTHRYAELLADGDRTGVSRKILWSSGDLTFVSLLGPLLCLHAARYWEFLRYLGRDHELHFRMTNAGNLPISLLFS